MKASNTNNDSPLIAVAFFQYNLHANVHYKPDTSVFNAFDHHTDCALYCNFDQLCIDVKLSFILLNDINLNAS